MIKIVLNFQEEKELEILKTDNKIKLINAQAIDREIEHNQKVARLNIMLDIAVAGGKTVTEE